jgi:hypothetical protein
MKDDDVTHSGHLFCLLLLSYMSHMRVSLIALVLISLICTALRVSLIALVLISLICTALVPMALKLISLMRMLS